ncbi:MAG: VOC family protein [Pseudomonadota bacterium]
MPDLHTLQRFLVDFGLDSWVAEDRVLYGRGRDGVPFNYSAEEGPPAFCGIGLRADGMGALEQLSAAEGKPIEVLNAPGGGRVVRLTDPDGVLVEVVAGQLRTKPDALKREPARNSALDKGRLGTPVRLEPGPATVIRLGHCVMNVSDFRVSERWYKERFGFITSDEIEASPGVSMGAFMRCDRGDALTDHHTLFLAQLPQKTGFMHGAYEVSGFDDLMLGHAYLKATKRDAVWGVGRHVLGSQIFDYWKDPWGHELEHWTDGDLFTAKDGSNCASVADLLNVQWGMQSPVLSGRLAPSSRLVVFALGLNLKLRRWFRRSSKRAGDR